MARWLGKIKYATKQLDAVLTNWQRQDEHVELDSYNFAIHYLSPLNVKDRELAVAIGAAALSIITATWFDNNWHNILTETCEEGYEAGFIVRDIIIVYRETYNPNISFN